VRNEKPLLQVPRPLLVESVSGCEHLGWNWRVLHVDVLRGGLPLSFYDEYQDAAHKERVLGYCKEDLDSARFSANSAGETKLADMIDKLRDYAEGREEAWKERKENVEEAAQQEIGREQEAQEREYRQSQ
jgi:hypothetical protein